MVKRIDSYNKSIIRWVVRLSSFNHLIRLSLFFKQINNLPLPVLSRLKNNLSIPVSILPNKLSLSCYIVFPTKPIHSFV